ncbi:hypothetical protein AtubIFM56815_003676 [Aspergillus tubingensis]|uniref:Uncharacterized protein n=1 Tax=Aspergillus tubingensis TaxID=5068 RepID=A0A9W6ERB9_ASPTU|nr:hypothetical protein AtubIFM56815_003676 [Aspergillus tubingensis]
MFFNKPSILAATLAIFASGVVSQIIEIGYGSSASDTYQQKVELQQLTGLDRPGGYTYFSTSATCDLYDSPEDDPVLRGVSGSREIPTTYINGVYCYTGETKEGDGEGDAE